MGSIQKVGDDYFIEFYARGLKYQQKVGSDIDAAQRALDSIEAKIEKGEAATIVRDVDHDIFFQDFLNFAKESHSPKTCARFLALILDFQKFLKRDCPSLTKLSEITPRIMELYNSSLSSLQSEGKKQPKPKVINFTFFLLRDVFEYAIKLGHLNDNPTLHIRLPKVPLARTLGILNDDELKQVFNASDSYFWFFIEFMLLTGVRPEEIIDLKWPDIDWSIHCFRVKRNALRDVALNARALDILKQLQNKKYKSAEFVFTDQNGHELMVPKLEETLQRIVTQCGFKKEVNFKTFQHIFARNLIKRGVTVSLLYKILGYKDIAKVITYSQFISDYWENDIYKA